MKKYLVLTIAVLAVAICKAQGPVIYGLTDIGGSGNAGSIFHINANGSDYTTDFSFYNRGTQPVQNVIEASNGLLYGVTSANGGGFSGTIYSYNPATATETELHSFGLGTDGRIPSGHLTQINDSLLYGLTFYGGKYNYGSIYSYNINTGIETVVYSFCDTFYLNDNYPDGALLLASNGLLYGATLSDGYDGYGVIFSFDISTGIQTDLYDFNGGWFDGAEPSGNLIEVGDSVLYGTTGHDGLDSTGVIFKYSINTGLEKVVYNFGSYPNYNTGSVIQANDSLLFALSGPGGANNAGSIISYNIISNIATDVHDFGSGTDGTNPGGALLLANDGLLYGSTYQGGTNNAGIIFSYSPATGKESDIYDFPADSPFDSEGAFIQVANGLLYGIGNPTLFTFNISSGVLTNLYRFTAGTTGMNPQYPFIMASNGLCYGVTQLGGKYYGTIYSYDITSKVFTNLYDFGVASDSDGLVPTGALTQAANGLLYGVTFNGGTHSKGTIYSFNIATGKEKVEYNFDKEVNGEYPYGTLLQASDGLLYGVANGGPNDTAIGGAGVIFSFNTSTENESTVYQFGSTGIYPNSPLIQATNGLLYGTTVYGGQYKKQNLFGGTIFSFNISTGAETEVHNFGKDTDGILPNAGLIRAADGLLYGITSEGGTHDTLNGGDGVMFSFNIANDSETVVYNFDHVSTNWSPIPIPLFLSSNGSLYGGTLHGGVNNSGTIFKYDISSGKYNDIHDYSNLDLGALTGLVEIDSVVSPVWPGDANDDLTVTNFDLLPIGVYYGVTGYPRDTITNTWAPHPARNWDSTQANGYNLKFADCNGDGTINADDTMAVTLNYGDTHVYHSPRNAAHERSSGVPLYFSADSTSYFPGDKVHISVMLGTSSAPADNIYGLAYDFGFDTSQILQGSEAFTCGNSFLGVKNVNALSLSGITNAIEAAVVGTDHNNKTGYGKIGDLYFTLNSTITNPKLIFSVSSYEAIDAAGTILNVQPINDTLYIDIATNINQLSVNNNKLSIYPNPTLGIFTIDLDSNRNGYTVEIINVLGQTVLKSPLGDLGVIDLSSQSAGLYFVYVKSGEGIQVSKILVTK